MIGKDRCRRRGPTGSPPTGKEGQTFVLSLSKGSRAAFYNGPGAGLEVELWLGVVAELVVDLNAGALSVGDEEPGTSRSRTPPQWAK